MDHHAVHSRICHPIIHYFGSVITRISDQFARRKRWAQVANCDVSPDDENAVGCLTSGLTTVDFLELTCAHIVFCTGTRVCTRGPTRARMG